MEVGKWDVMVKHSGVLYQKPKFRKVGLLLTEPEIAWLRKVDFDKSSVSLEQARDMHPVLNGILIDLAALCRALTGDNW